MRSMDAIKSKTPLEQLYSARIAIVMDFIVCRHRRYRRLRERRTKQMNSIIPSI